MCEVLKERPIVLEQFPQHGFAVILVPRPEDMMMRPRHISNGIELNKSESFDDL